MAKTFYVSPGRSYTVTASEGTTITYPGITTPAATVGASGSVTFNCTGTEITVSDDSAQIVQNFNNAGAAVVGAGEGSGGSSTDGVALLEGGNSFNGNQTILGNVVVEGSLTVTGELEGVIDNLKDAQPISSGIISGALISGYIYDLGVLTQNQDLSSLAFDTLNGYVQTCEVWMETGDTGYSITWPSGAVWPDEPNGAAPSLILSGNTRYRFAVRNEGNGTVVITKAYEYSV